ncbi:MAG: hypothetical protein MI924_16455 [Chloroflexales bacterium]|nr:hypothetical protein [Chloroflexales bacterium]
MFGFRYALQTGVILLMAAFIVLPSIYARVVAQESMLYVTTDGADTNDCTTLETACQTIGAAINKAPTGSAIQVAAGVYSEMLSLSKDVTITGATPTTTVIEGKGGAIVTNFAAAATLSNLTLRGGMAVGSGGGVNNFGTLALINSIVANNLTFLGEGSQGFGGGIANFGTLTISNTAVVSNTGSVGGGIYNEGVLTAANVTISGNAASGAGGGIFNTSGAKLSLNNVTITANRADSDEDDNGVGGGIFNDELGEAHLSNTLISDDLGAGGGDDDCYGALVATGRNLIEAPGDCEILGQAASDLIRADPRLAPLQASGPMLVAPLLVDSPAIDAGNTTTCEPTDQRGVTRPQGAACDIGAFETDSIPSDDRRLEPNGDDSHDCR